MLSTPPTSASAARPGPSIPAASKTPTMLVLHCMTGREGRDVRVELRLEPDLARQIGVGKVHGDRTPNAKVYRAFHPLCHPLHDGYRQRQRIAVSKRTIHADEGRAHARKQPNR